MVDDSFYVLPHDNTSPEMESPLSTPRHLRHKLSIIREVSEESSAASTPHNSPRRCYSSNHLLGHPSSNTATNSSRYRSSSPSLSRSPSPDDPQPEYNDHFRLLDLTLKQRLFFYFFLLHYLFTGRLQLMFVRILLTI